jgi:hypothetical protein
MNKHVLPNQITAKASPVLGNTAAPALVPAKAGAAPPIGAASTRPSAGDETVQSPTEAAGASNRLTPRPTCPTCGKVIYQCIGHSDFDDDEMMPASEVREIMDKWFPDRGWGLAERSAYGMAVRS